VAFDSRLCLCRLPLQVVSFFGWNFFSSLITVLFYLFMFFFINKVVRTSLYVYRLILRVLKLMTV